MQTGWLAKAGAYTVEHVPCPHPNVKILGAGCARGVQHTTEGWTVESALSVFKREYAPHFLLGRDDNKKVRLLQLIPLGYIAAALEHPAGTPQTNGGVRAQIELVGFSQHQLWLPDYDVQCALSALYQALQKAVGIPLRHVPNLSRSRKTFADNGGWFGHGDVPDQPSGHWDPGFLDYARLFARASAPPTLPVKKPKAKPKPIVLAPRTYLLVRRANGLVYADQIDRPH